MTGEEFHESGHSTELRQAPRRYKPLAIIAIIILGAVWVMFQGGKILDVFDEMFPSTYVLPALSEEEQGVASKIMSKAIDRPLTEAEIARFKDLQKAYCVRTKVSPSALKMHPEIGIAVLELRCRYEHEYASCLLTSFDRKALFVSQELERLTLLCRKNECQGGITRKALLADLENLESAVNGTDRIDEDGESDDPITREEILTYLEWAGFCNENVAKLKKASEEVVASMIK